MNDPYVIRTLSDADVSPFRAMLDLFAEAFEQPEIYTHHQPDDPYLRQLLGSPTFVAVAALCGAEVVGGLAGYVLPKFEQPRSELYIYDLAVRASHRRLGIARAMIEEVRGLASRRGIHVIFVQADREDDAAVALYSQVGMREEVLHFDIPAERRS